jgi:hypothetical protein
MRKSRFSKVEAPWGIAAEFQKGSHMWQSSVLHIPDMGLIWYHLLMVYLYLDAACFRIILQRHSSIVAEKQICHGIFVPICMEKLCYQI